ncbi:hypothetical protein [Desulfoscipio geothermicus]|uniref:hypothetical protein n=1 Tax=Desulfoscipio geothermicus TaxID=39060 RepID=UPI000A5D87DC|nr:hypothetical protein [Desulfoscipio geothermicus]
MLGNPESLPPDSEAGNGRRDGRKAGRIGQPAAEPLCRKAGEGSTTRAYHLRPPSGTVMKPVGRLEAPEAPGSRRKRRDEDIV